MDVLLVRHGEAVDSFQADSDAHRWLTANGRTTVRGVGALIAEAGLRFDRVFTSPLVRAVQTAEILAGVLGFVEPLEVWPALAGGTTAMALGALEHANEGETVALVGHEPLIRAMTGVLLGIRHRGFYPGEAWLVGAGGTSRGFRWRVDPKRLVRIEQLDG